MTEMGIRAQLASLLIFTACTGELPPAADGGLTHHVDSMLTECAQHQSNVPSVAGFVRSVNELPRPVSVACVVASLPRPLELVATNAVVSQQPAAGPLNPRIFILQPALAISVVGGGSGAKLIELGQWVTPTRTVKGEIEFPVVEPLTAGAPFSRVLYSSTATNCGFCHSAEAPSDEIDGGFVSDAYRPLDQTLVSFDVLRAHHDDCADAGDSGERCALYHALFDFGAVRASAFRDEIKTFGR